MPMGVRSKQAMAQIIQFRRRPDVLYPAIDVLPAIQMARIYITWTAVTLLAVASQLELIEQYTDKGADQSPR
jgi:hypothetical protein